VGEGVRYGEAAEDGSVKKFLEVVEFAFATGFVLLVVYAVVVFFLTLGP
jgi:hypothetical protein